MAIAVLPACVIVKHVEWSSLDRVFSVSLTGAGPPQALLPIFQSPLGRSSIFDTVALLAGA